MFFERRTARGPPSRKKRCRPSPPNRATAIRRHHRRLSQPPRRFLLRRDPPWHPRLVNIHRYRVRAIQEYRNLSFPCADPRESRFIGRRRECPRLRARSPDGIPADGTASYLLPPSNSFFLRMIRWGWGKNQFDGLLFYNPQ